MSANGQSGPKLNSVENLTEQDRGRDLTGQEKCKHETREWRVRRIADDLAVEQNMKEAEQL